VNTHLQKVLLFRSVTFLVRGKPVAADHLSAADGYELVTDDATQRVLVKVDGQTVYRVAYANVAGDLPMTEEEAERQALEALEKLPKAAATPLPGAEVAEPMAPPPAPPEGVKVNPNPYKKKR
jgi:hypothetical protein